MAKERTPTRETLAKTLRFLMQRTGLSEAEVAKRSGVSKKSINNMLNARHAPNLDHVDAVAKVFGLNLWHLIMPTMAKNLDSSGRLDKLIERYTASDEQGKESIERVAEMASEFRAKR